MALQNWLFLASTIALGAVPATAAPLDVTPVADHHQHLFSPMLANKINGALAPYAAVPPTIRSFLGRREAAWNDPKALRKLVTNDVETLTRSRSGWIRGGDKVADYLGTLFGRSVSYTPTQIRVHGNSAELSGYYTRGSGPERQTLGFFQMSLERGPAGWRMSREVPIFPIPEEQKPITAEDLIALLDAAGIRKAVVLSEAFWWDSPALGDSDPLDEVRAENEWTAQQVAKYPDRLVAFCSFSPLASYALAELDRCAADKRFRGLKLSFAMSGIDITKPEHLAAVQALFRAANGRRLPITVHLSSGRGYGEEHARLFVDKVLPLAPDVDVQIAHLWGGEAFSKPALDVLVDAVRRQLPGTSRLYFDTAEIWTAGSQANLEAAAQAIGAVGVWRVRYGSDAALNGRLKPVEAWRRLQFDVPLDDNTYRALARQVAIVLP
jgi:predicted TIM-barrel fold metal-dependent hydrolase